MATPQLPPRATPASAAPARPGSLRNPNATADKRKATQEEGWQLLQQEADSKRKAGKYEEAISAFNSVLKIQPKSVKALSGRAAAHRALGEREVAVADYDAALKLEPGSASLLSSRGVVKSELGWYRDASADFQAALRRNPQETTAAWGQNMVAQQENNAPLRMITLRGFKAVANMNTQFVERRQRECSIAGHETYWSSDNKLVLYWSSEQQLWKGCRAIDLPRLSAGKPVALVGAPHRGNLLSPSMLKGWFEWDGNAWVKLEEAGVVSIGAVSAPLRSVTLEGFKRPAVNASYTERRQHEFLVNARETYWSADGRFFLYWCTTETRWRGCSAKDLQKVQNGATISLFGAPRGADILSASVKRGWHEFINKEWAFSQTAGASIEPRGAMPRTVTLVGFRTAGVSGEYKENRQKEFMINDREIYSASSGGHFLYWSKDESRWKGSLFTNHQKIQGGKSLAVIGAPPGGDLLSMSLLRGWYEWDGKQWAFRPNAGVGGVATSREARPAKREGEAAAPAAKKRKVEPQPATRKTNSRQELIRDVFRHFDKDKDQLLKGHEMLHFARSVGFDGSEAEWKEEYRMICKGLGRSPERGVDEASFWKLVNEDSDDGCYCSDKELAGMLGLKMPPPRK